MRIVGGKAGLRRAHHDQVREAVHQHPMHAAIAIGPVLGQFVPVPPTDIIARPACVFGAHLKASGIDQAVDLIGFAIGHNRRLGNLLHTLPIRMDKFHIGPVERRQVIVVEAGPLAELAIPRLQRIGRFRV